LLIQIAIRRVQQLLDRSAISRVDCSTHTHGEWRLLAVASELLGHSFRYMLCRLRLRFREDHYELVPSIARRGVDLAGMHLQNVREPAEGAVAHGMPKRVVDLLQPIQV